MERIAALRAHSGSSRAVKLLIAGIAAATVMAFSAEQAGASYGSARADSDGNVPVVSSCWSGNTVGLYKWYFDGYTTQGTIFINDCALDRLGAGPNDRQAVIAHERGHANGLTHSSNSSSAMSPVLYITGN